MSLQKSWTRKSKNTVPTHPSTFMKYRMSPLAAFWRKKKAQSPST
jgi:hypothetical protein